MLKVAILISEEEGAISEFEFYIKPVPRISAAEVAQIKIDYNKLKSAEAFCEVAFSIIEKIENTHTVFSDSFSERLFVKTFKEVGFPIGRATFILQKIFKNTVGGKIGYSLEKAAEIMGFEVGETRGIEECRLMKIIFESMPEIGKVDLKKQLGKNIATSLKDTLKSLPNTPGIYFFRNENGDVIYVGKAVNISKRVKSHFNSAELFERELCTQTAEIDYEETGSELVALLLETHYINTLIPRLNTQQKEILQPYIITSKLNSKGILRLQAVKKSYKDSENEFYYNRDSVIQKLGEVQRKFQLCKRYAGMERAKGPCSDTIHCRGICKGEEEKEIYNARVNAALEFIYTERPSYIIKLKGRSNYELGLVLVKHGLYCGFGFIDSESEINNLNDMEGFVKKYPHNYFTSRILDQYHKANKRMENNLLTLDMRLN